MATNLRKGETYEGNKNQWIKDIMVFRDQCGQTVEYSDGGRESGEIEGME